MHDISEHAPNHQLKTVDPFFTDVWEGRKNFEIRKNDRDFKVGDILWLEEYRAPTFGLQGKYYNRVIVVRVDYIITHQELGAALKNGYVCMSINILEKVTVDSFC